MGFESAADLAAYFAADMGAETATFTPATGAPVSCTILVQRPQETSGVGYAGVAAYNTTIMVRASEIAGSPAAGTFSVAPQLGGLSYSVSEALVDETGGVWTCHVRPTT